MLIFGLLTFTIPVLARAQALPVQKLHLSLEGPAYTGLPVWIKVDLAYPYEARYPYSEEPSDFGPNEIEVKRGNQMILPPWPQLFGGFSGEGIRDGSAAPPDAPKNRLPLHLKYRLDEPGAYSVRWTAVRHAFQGSGLTETEVVVARSDWLTFEVKPSTPAQREAWLKKELAVVPSDPGLLVGEFLPSLLAAAPDPRVLRTVLEQLYSQDQLVGDYALRTVGLFDENDLRAQALELVRHRGLSERMAYLISWNAQFQGCREELVRTTLPYLHSPDDRQVAATLYWLGSVIHAISWPATSDIPVRADREVLAAAPALVKRGGNVPQMLALYLGDIKSDESRRLLWQVAEGNSSGREQALTVLTWIADDRDLPRLGEMLRKPGDADVKGGHLTNLPYGLMHGYGDRAIPYLEQAIAASPYVFVRTQCAEELILRQRPAAIGFFLDAIESHRFYKQELVQWLIDHCGLPRKSDDQAAVAFLKSPMRWQHKRVNQHIRPNAP